MVSNEHEHLIFQKKIGSGNGLAEKMLFYESVLKAIALFERNTQAVLWVGVFERNLLE